MNLSDADVQEIIRLLDDSAYDELDLETEGLRLVLRRGADGRAGWSQQRQTRARSNRPDVPDATALQTDSENPPSGPKTVAHFEVHAAARVTGHDSADVSPHASRWANDGLLAIRSPIVGTFYRSPRPGADPFVTPGSRVGADTVVAIIEVMKLMNSVAAGLEGEIVEIVVEDGELIQKGQCLMCVRPLQDLASGVTAPGNIDTGNMATDQPQ